MLEVFLIWLSGAVVVLLSIGVDILYHKIKKRDYAISLGEFTMFTLGSWITVLAILLVVGLVVVVWSLDKIGTFFVWLVDRDMWHKEMKLTFNKKQNNGEEKTSTDN